MKRIANNVAVQTILYSLHGAQQVKIGYYEYGKVRTSEITDYQTSGFTKILYEGEAIKAPLFERWRSQKIDFISCVDGVLLIGVDEKDWD